MLAKTLFIGKNFIDLTECYSTNDYAVNLIKYKGPAEGTLIITENQKKGKGQRNNVWESLPGKNLTFSIILKPEILVQYQFFLNIVACCGIIEALNNLKSEKKFLIKWPNDIFYENYKTGGVLIENIIKNNKIQFSVVGIGINVNQADFSFDNATSLKNIMKYDLDKNYILNILCSQIEKWYLQLKKGIPNEKMIEFYQQNMLNFRKKTNLKKGNVKFTGILHGIDNEGFLIVEYNNKFFKYQFKEIEFIGSQLTKN